MAGMKTVNVLNTGVATLGVSYGFLPLFGIASPELLITAGWLALGVAGLFFLFGKKTIF